MTCASPASRLRALAAAATIGTDRSTREAGSPEKLLSEAAIAGAQARAGFRARPCSGHSPECPADSTPVAGPAAMTTLTRLLGDPDAGLIAEWADLAHARGLRVADTTVPIVLDWWCRQPQRRAVVFGVCGKRGEWLASLNPAWKKPVAGEEAPANADEIWQTGRTPERLAVLVTVRRQAPARALSLVQSTWASDGADERRRFIEALGTGCTIAEEPFLEAALDDKSKVVRRAAAAVLAGLPGSRLKARMNERARAIITVEGKKGLLRKSPKVSINPPQEFDKSWERDGLEEQAASGTGKRVWWMRQILSAADLAVWTEVVGRTPEGVLDAIGDDDYFGNALEAITQALETRGDAAWAAAVVRRRLAGKKLDPVDLAGLIGALEPEERQALVLEAAEHKRFNGIERWAVLALADHRWSREFSAGALKLLARSAPRKGEMWGLYEPVERVSRVVSPELAEEFAEAVAAMFTEELTDSFKRSIDRVRLRAEMHKEFAT